MIRGWVIIFWGIPIGGSLFFFRHCLFLGYSRRGGVTFFSVFPRLNRQPPQVIINERSLIHSFTIDGGDDEDESCPESDATIDGGYDEDSAESSAESDSYWKEGEDIKTGSSEGPFPLNFF